MALVEAKGLVKLYRMGSEEIHALDGIDLTIERGEFVSVMGRSGSGKSTLLNVLGCLDRPTQGSVFLDGIEVSRAKEQELPRVRRERVGLVFQHFNLLPTLTALENVVLPLRYAGVPNGRRAELGERALELVGLAHRMNHRPAELSGGEQQRVAIARAVVNRPAILLADEPTGELDTHTAGEVIQMMQRLNREEGQTIVIVTHDPLVSGRTSRVIRLQDGRIESDTRQEPANVARPVGAP